MERRFEVRKQEMLAECDVSPKVFGGVVDRKSKFVEPFADLLTQSTQGSHARDYVSGLVSDLDRKNVESIAYRHDQDRRNLQHFIGCAAWDHRPLMMELARQVGERLGEADGVLVFDPSVDDRGWMSLELDLLMFEQQLYLRQPGYGTSYITGKYLLERLMGEYSKILEERGKEFVMADFFDEFNAAGSVPVALVRWQMTGRDDQIKMMMGED